MSQVSCCAWLLDGGRDIHLKESASHSLDNTLDKAASTIGLRTIARTDHGRLPCDERLTSEFYPHSIWPFRFLMEAHVIVFISLSTGNYAIHCTIHIVALLL